MNSGTCFLGLLEFDVHTRVGREKAIESSFTGFVTFLVLCFATSVLATIAGASLDDEKAASVVVVAD